MKSLARQWFVGPIAFLVSVFPLAAVSYGSGYGIFTHGASALGQGDSVVAHGDSPSSIFFNPALITELPGTQVEIGTTAIVPVREFTSSTTGQTSTTEDTVYFPSTFYLTHKLNETVSLGLGLFNPFGLGTNWGDDWEGRYIATKSEIETYNINPVVAYRPVPQLSVAAGLDIVILDATLEAKTPSTLLGIPGPAFDVAQKFTGSGTGVGFNTGVHYKITDSLSFGASYRSQVKIKAKGDMSLDISPQKTDAEVSVTLPQQVFAGVAYKASERLIVEGGMRWEDWASFKQLQVDLSGQPSVIYPRSWHSTYSINAGGKYRFNDTFSFLAGYLFGWNAVPEATFEPAIPDSNSHLFCVGSEMDIDRVRVALSYGYQLMEEREKETNLYGAFANGTYDSTLHLIGLSLTYRF